MQVIHVETEKNYENAVARLIADRIMNHDPELVVNTAEAAAYLNNDENVGEEINLEEDTGRSANSEGDALRRTVEIIVEKLMIILKPAA